MIYEKIGLTDDPSVYLEVYAPDKLKNLTRDALLVIPGGGYEAVCSDREGEPIAFDFLQKGMTAFVLHYSIGKKAKFPRPLIEASLAMQYIRLHAEDYRINKKRVFATGFSAGGHLTTALGTLWHLPEIYEATGMAYGINKPTGIIPVYPVVSAMVPTHAGSFYNLLGTTEPTEEEKRRYSLELSVDEKSSPACIIHTSDDGAVPVFNSLVLANAYAQKNIPFELHIYKSGPHGMALANKITEVDNPQWNNEQNATWTSLAAGWISGIPDSSDPV